MTPRLRAAALAATLLLIAAAPSTADADETAAPPAALAAYNLDWINYIDPADLPATRYAVCIVDTGTMVTPDTPPDDPINGPILARLSDDGGSGEPFDTSVEQEHGTRMAMAAVAPQNDWGTIGEWSAGRIVSVRETRDGESTFRVPAYSAGVTRCIKAEASLGVPMAAVSYSLACDGCEPTDSDLTFIEDEVAVAHNNGLSVVLAAGNVGGGAQFPAGEAGVFAVGAGGPDGRLCDYGSFDARVAVLGPACPVETADPLSGEPFPNELGGSSSATVSVSMLLALLRTLRPDATWDQAEAWLRDSARLVDGRPVLDGAAAARAAGLGEVVNRAQAREPATAEPTPTVTPTPAAAETATATATPGSSIATIRRLPRPRVRSARWRPPLLRIRVSGRPHGARLQLLSSEVVTSRVADRLHVELGTAPRRLRLRYLPGGGDSRRASRWVKLARHGHRYG